MASTVEAPKSKTYVEFDEYIDFQLQKTRANIKTTDVLTAVAGALVLLFGYLLLFVVCDHWVVPGGFGYATRLLMLLGLLTAIAAWVGWKVIRPSLKEVTPLFAARAIEQTEPRLRSSLLNLVDLRRAPRKVSPEILASLEKRAARSLANMDVDRAVDRRQLMQVSYALLFVVVVSCLYTLFSPKKISDSVWRALFPASQVAAPTRTQILEVKPGDAEVLAGAQLEVTADLRGEIPERVVLYFTTADRRHVDEVLQMRPADGGLNRFRAILAGDNGRGILQNLTYRVEAGDDRSDDFKVTVFQRPAVTVHEVHYEYPAYMELAPRTQPGGTIDAWEGTAVTVVGTANMPLSKKDVVFRDVEGNVVPVGGDRKPQFLVSTETRIEVRWLLSLTDDIAFYELPCVNRRGDADPDPARHSIKVRRDQPPQVELLWPESDLERPANAIVPLAVRARDPDFKLTRVELIISRDNHATESKLLLDPADTQPRQSMAVTYPLRLRDLGVQPGAELTLSLRAYDNKLPQPNVGESSSRKIRILEAEDSPQKTEEQRVQDQRQLQQRLDELRQGANPDDPAAEPPPPPPEAQAPPDEAQPREPPGAGGRQPQPQADENQSTESNDPQPGRGDGQPGGSGGRSDQPDAASGERRADDDEALRELLQRYTKESGQQGPAAGPPQNSDAGSKQGGDPSAKTPPEAGRQPSGEQPPADPHPPRDDPALHDGDPPGQNDEPGRAGPSGSAANGADPRPRPAGTPGSGEQTPPPDGPAGQSQPTTSQERPSGDTSQPGGGKPEPGSNRKPPQSADQPLNGTEEPAAPSDAARERPATGDETGRATAGDDPNAEAPTARHKLEREPGEQGPTRTRPGDPSGKPAIERPSPPGGTSPESPPPAADGGNRPPQEGNAGGAAGKPPADQSDPTSKPQPGGAGSKPSQTGEVPARSDAGRTGEGQPADPGEPKSSDLPPAEASPEATGARQPPGEPHGDQRGQPDGGQGPAENPDGLKPPGQRPGSEPTGGQRSDSQSGEGGQAGRCDSPGGKPRGDGGGKSPQAEGEQPGQEGRGQGSGKPGSESRPSAGEQPGSSSGASKSGSGGQLAGTPGNRAGEGGGESSGPPPGDEANLEFTRQAANLMLNRLEEDLQRGEVDRELLDRLGWTKEDLQRFSDRLRQQLQSLDEAGAEETPASQARRRQFEEMLKSLDLRTPQESRAGREGGRATEGVGSREVPVPAEYREAYEAFTRSLSKHRGGPEPAR